MCYTDISFEMETIKVILVGDDGVGKSSFLARYTAQTAPSGEYTPTVFDNSLIKIQINGKELAISFWDTAGLNEYNGIRPLAYTLSNLFLVFFATTNRKSFENVVTRWYPEIIQHVPTVALVLIGTKIDSREQNNNEHIQTDEGLLLAEQINALKYIECSSVTGDGVDAAIKDAIEAFKTIKIKKIN